MCERSQAKNKGIYRSTLVDVKKNAAAAGAVETSFESSESCGSSSSSSEYGQLFSLPLTIKFIAVTILLSAASAFSMGCIARIFLLSEFGCLPSNLHQHHIDYPTETEAAATKTYQPRQLPVPTILPGKEVPVTTYTAKTFPIEGSASTSHTLLIDRRGSIIHEEEDDEATPTTINDYSHNDDSDGLHLPAGQHLLVDMKDVNSSFLNSEERLATAMVELINESKLTLLSYHCHSLIPIGVSCAGVLLESHIAFHTWPKEGIITMDLFTCGGNPLIPVLPSIQKLFGVPRSPVEDEDKEDIPDPTMLWSHKLRGFRDGFVPGYDSERNPLDQDLGRYVLGTLDLDVKNQLVSAKTDFQTVDVYDVMYPRFRSMESYQMSLEEAGGSYESDHPEQFGPDRILFLDGVIQSTLYGDAPYHESIVHPAMITHPNPKRVAIIGGGEGATLREVLKHNTVEEAVMIEIDEGVVELSSEHLPQWQDCTSISHHEKAADWCFDDERVNARFEDAMAYFIDHFANDNKEQTMEAAYDIIIMDALDPNDDIEFAVELYTSDTYIQSLYNALTGDGILVVQVGEVPTQTDPADETGRFANRSTMKDKLGEVGFKRWAYAFLEIFDASLINLLHFCENLLINSLHDSIHVYEESHSGFLAPWSTLVAFKDIQTRENWYRNAAEIELQLHKRILPKRTGASSLRYFDGATMSSYQVPSSAFETVHCRQEDVPEDCMGETTWLGGAVVANGTNTKSTIAYNPVIERHGSRENLHPLHNIHGWKEILLN
ncbi:hypothetical protein ACHAXR_012757 [Thalassiosira sp. AJA248-18]